MSSNTVNNVVQPRESEIFLYKQYTISSQPSRGRPLGHRRTRVVTNSHVDFEPSSEKPSNWAGQKEGVAENALIFVVHSIFLRLGEKYRSSFGTFPSLTNKSLQNEETISFKTIFKPNGN